MMVTSAKRHGASAGCPLLGNRSAKDSSRINAAQFIAHMHLHVPNNVAKKVLELEFSIAIPHQHSQLPGVDASENSSNALRPSPVERLRKRKQGGHHGERFLWQQDPTHNAGGTSYV